MKKAEIQKLIDRYNDGTVLTTKELNNFIDNEMIFDNAANRNFAIFDLTRQNILYQLNTDLYKISKRKFYKFVIPEEISEYVLNVGLKYPKLKMCIWETVGLNPLLEMQLLKNIIFVEVEAGLESLVLEQLNQTDRFSVFIKPDFSYLDAYRNNRPIIIIKTLIYKAPVNKKRFSSRIGYNTNYAGNVTSISTPKIEKVIVDLIADSSFQIIDDSQRTSLIRNALTDYIVNFRTLLSYARSRNKKDYILDYLKNELKFDIYTGEFYD